MKHFEVPPTPPYPEINDPVVKKRMIWLTPHPHNQKRFEKMMIKVKNLYPDYDINFLTELERTQTEIVFVP